MLLWKFIPIWLAYVAAAISPGPSQAFVLETSVYATKNQGHWGAFGVTLGTAIWVLLVAFGLSALVNSFPSGKFVLSLGSTLLIGYFLVRNLIIFLTDPKAVNQKTRKGSQSPLKAFTAGFFVNLINPNSVVFFLSLLAPMLLTTRNPTDLWICIVGIMILSLIWYQTLAIIASHRHLKKFLHSSGPLMRVCFCLIYLYFFVINLQRLISFE